MSLTAQAQKHKQLNYEVKDMKKNLVLNEVYVEQANRASHFNAGNIINENAQRCLEGFDSFFSKDNLTEEQLNYLAERKEQWRVFVLDFFNDHCRRRGDYMPPTVCGFARYPQEKMTKRVDRMMELAGEFHEKKLRFIANTEKKLAKLIPAEKEIERFAKGQWEHGETVSAADSNALEKMQAKLAYLEKKHSDMKAINKIVRNKKISMQEKIEGLCKMGLTPENAEKLLEPDCMGVIGFAQYSLTNNLANIKNTKSRIASLEKMGKMEVKEEKTEAYIYREDPTECRVMFIFDGKPEDAVRTILKRNGFKWSPKRSAWTRQFTGNGQRAASYVKKELASL